MRLRRIGRGAEHTAPLNLDLAVRNFGPVEHGSVAIRPLTIFIGPNNSGKSYMAMLLRSILAAQSQIADSDWRMHSGTVNYYDLLRHKYDQNRYKISITKTESKKILSDIVDADLKPALKRQIARDFGSEARELVRTGKNSASVELSEKDPASGEVRKLTITLSGELSVKATVKTPAYVIEALPGSRYYHISTSGHNGSRRSMDKATDAVRLVRLPMDESNAKDDVHARALSTTFAMDVTERISDHFNFKTIPDSVHYFPAARSGILQGHKALAASIVAHAQYGGIEPIEMPQVTGVVGDLLSGIILLKQRNGPFSPVANEMENELFGGNIMLDTHVKNGYPEIAYHYNGSRVPLHRSSSTISEIAPLSLYLKHVIGVSSLLIIEEPEAHLHPANQLVLGKYLVRLVRSGICILMTTHSVFLLEKLAKYMMAGSLSPEQRSADLGYGEDDYLSPDEVSAYLFEKCAGGGHRIKEVERDEEYGISQEEFVKVSEALHHETIVLNSKMRAPGHD